MRVRRSATVSAVAVCALLAACSAEAPTLPHQPAAAPALHDAAAPQGGWVGGGGRTDVTTASLNGGWVGGGGFVEMPDSTSTH